MHEAFLASWVRRRSVAAGHGVLDTRRRAGHRVRDARHRARDRVRDARCHACHRVGDANRRARHRVLDACRHALARLRHLLSSLVLYWQAPPRRRREIPAAVSYLLNGSGGAVLLQLRAVGRGSGGVLDALRRVLRLVLHTRNHMRCDLLGLEWIGVGDAAAGAAHLALGLRLAGLEGLPDVRHCRWMI